MNMDRNKAYLSAAKVPALALLGLLVLLAINIVCAWLPLGRVRPIINIAVCVAMALTLMTFWMHLRRSGALLRVVAAAGFVWLCILIGISLTDFLARVAVPPPW